jgi:hypothetical protein
MVVAGRARPVNSLQEAAMLTSFASDL